MAKPRKGIVPPQLRAFLLKKGETLKKGVGRVARAARGSPRSPSPKTARPAKPRGPSVTKGKSGGMFEDIKRHARPIEMLLMGGLGYIIGPALNQTGLPMALYNASPKYHAFVDAMYAASENAGLTGNSNPWSGGGGSGIMKLVGGGLGIQSSYEIMSSGRMASKHINARLPFAIGAILDPAGPQGSTMPAGSGLSVAGTMAGTAGYASAAGGGGWV